MSLYATTAALTELRSSLYRLPGGIDPERAALIESCIEQLDYYDEDADLSPTWFLRGLADFLDRAVETQPKTEDVIRFTSRFLTKEQLGALNYLLLKGEM
jgi:HD-GYP domain-containing protein (c-di-GMP phosphodiesterase class II)